MNGLRVASLLIATTNAKKLAELEEALAGLPVRLVGLDSFAGLAEVAETGATFEENAALKAVGVASQAFMLTLADDSGLEVDALDGRPGVRSARYASTGDANATDAANRAKLLAELRGVPAAKRTARFRCAIAVARGEEVVLTAAGAVEGRILEAERGSGGFGYDSLFVPLLETQQNGMSQITAAERTFAEMPAEEKLALSHRGRAIAALRPQLLTFLGG
jgi:XTP/dITP diphosphohydrolase